MAIGTQQYTIRALFEQKQTFSVPKYQRGYAWDDQAVSDFIGDLTNCLSARLSDSNRRHFFGGVVTTRSSAKDSTRDNYEVIDGQQRLASFVILAACIVKRIREVDVELGNRERLEPREEEARKYFTETLGALEGLYIRFRDHNKLTYFDVPKLTLSKADNAFFQKIITGEDYGEPARESHQRILDAFEDIDSFVNENLTCENYDVTKKAELVQGFLDNVLGTDCTAVFMCSDDKSEAHQVFQVLNDRGVNLGKGDLLRARTLELLDEDSHAAIQDRVAELWDELLRFNPNEIDDYLLWYFSSIEGRRPKPSDLTEEYLEHRFLCKDKELVDAAGANKILEEVKQMSESFTKMHTMMKGDWPFSANGSVTAWDRERLRMLIVHLNHSNAMPVLLSLIRLGQKQFSKAIQCIERFVFRYKAIVQAHITPATTIYLKHAIEIRQNSDYKLSSLQEDLAELSEKRASDAIFTAKLREKTYAPKRGNGYLRYFLIAIEDYKKWYERGAEGAPKCVDRARVFDFGNTTIEHIYSQNALPQHSDDELEEVKHVLGNLTIIDPDENIDLGNEPFEYKRRELNKSSLAINRDIARNRTWTRKKVIDRTETLVAMAQKVFVPIV